MALDFLTLYIVILLNSLTVSVIWAAIVVSYRSLTAARYWLAGCLLMTLGGAVLAIQGNAGALAPAVIGNGIVILGFFQLWVGVRRFFGEAGRQDVAVICTLISVVMMLVFHDNDRARSVVYSAGQSVPMLLGIIFVMTRRQYAIGRYIAAFAMAVGFIGHVSTITSNALVMAGHLDFAVFYQIASYNLLCVIFSGVVWNFGLAVMTIERLRSEVAELADRDELTGLANRRKLNERLAQEQVRSKSTGRRYALMVIDFDEFKEINDAHGHAAGDAALVHFAGVASTALRDGDLLARHGGDEFCALLPETDAEAAMVVAKRIQAELNASPLHWRDRRIPLQVSIGVADGPNSDAETYTTVLARADSALYRVKSEGRNGVAVFDAGAKRQPLRVVRTRS